MQRALVTCISGQESSYVAEWLLDKGCEVDRIAQRTSSFKTGRSATYFRAACRVRACRRPCGRSSTFRHLGGKSTWMNRYGIRK
jgi:hypothetical protein